MHNFQRKPPCSILSYVLLFRGNSQGILVWPFWATALGQTQQERKGYNPIVPRHEQTTPGLEDILYQTQNVASQLASLSLNGKDPGNLLASLPLLYAAVHIASCGRT